MTVYVLTNAELDAHALLRAAGVISVSSENIDSVRESANKIILLAEQIKAERATMAVHLAANT